MSSWSNTVSMNENVLTFIVEKLCPKNLLTIVEAKAYSHMICVSEDEL